MNNLPIYYLRNKVYKDAPEGATIIKGSTRVSEHERLGDTTTLADPSVVKNLIEKRLNK